MATTDIAIFGASGHGKVVAEIAEACGYTLKAVYDDDSAGKHIFETPATEFQKTLLPVALGIGSNNARQLVHERLKGEGVSIATLIHPSAFISPRAGVGAGTVIMPRVVINAQARIGEGVILNTGCIIEHDCVIGDFSHVSPRAALAGNVVVGARSHIGIGACIIQGVVIEEDVTVGAGAVVIGNVPKGSTVVGNPARIIKSS